MVRCIGSPVGWGAAVHRHTSVNTHTHLPPLPPVRRSAGRGSGDPWVRRRTPPHCACPQPWQRWWPVKGVMGGRGAGKAHSVPRSFSAPPPPPPPILPHISSQVPPVRTWHGTLLSHASSIISVSVFMLHKLPPVHLGPSNMEPPQTSLLHTCWWIWTASSPPPLLPHVPTLSHTCSWICTASSPTTLPFPPHVSTPAGGSVLPARVWAT